MFGWGSSKPAPASTPTEAPNREQRAACWTDRDAYFACLDSKGVQVIGSEGEACKKERAAYEGSCGRSWVGCTFGSVRGATGGRSDEGTWLIALERPLRSVALLAIAHA